MKQSNLALLSVEGGDANQDKKTNPAEPWALHRLLHIGPSIDIRCTNTAYTKERGKEDL